MIGKHPPHSQSPSLSVSAIEKSFSRAADTYDRYAVIQKQASRILLNWLPGYDFRNILEIGCGTGFLTRLLHKAFPLSSITAIDLSSDMLRLASQKLPSRRVVFSQADAQRLPGYLKGPFDLIVSSGAFQWFDRPEKTLCQLLTRLDEKGLLAFAAFGPRSLEELRISIEMAIGRKASSLLPVAGFLDHEGWKAVTETFFKRVESKVCVITRDYNNLIELLRALKHTGTSPACKKGPIIWSRAGFEKVEDVYMKLFFKITASYEIILCRGSLKRPPVHSTWSL